MNARAKDRDFKSRVVVRRRKLVAKKKAGTVLAVEIRSSSVGERHPVAGRVHLCWNGLTPTTRGGTVGRRIGDRPRTYFDRSLLDANGPPGPYPPDGMVASKTAGVTGAPFAEPPALPLTPAVPNPISATNTNTNTFTGLTLPAS